MKRADHFSAFLAAVPAPVAAHDSTVPIDSNGVVLRASYAVVHDNGAEDPPDDARLAKQQAPDDAVTWRYIVKSVGISPFAARAVDSAVAVGLIGKTLSVAGRKCDPVRMIQSGPVIEDKTVQPSLFYTESDYLLRSQRA